MRVMKYGENIMKNIRFKFLQQRIQQQRRAASNITNEPIKEEKMSSHRKEFLEMIEELKQDFNGKK